MRRKKIKRIVNRFERKQKTKQKSKKLIFVLLTQIKRVLRYVFCMCGWG